MRFPTEKSVVALGPSFVKTAWGGAGYCCTSLSSSTVFDPCGEKFLFRAMCSTFYRVIMSERIYPACCRRAVGVLVVWGNWELHCYTHSQASAHTSTGFLGVHTRDRTREPGGSRPFLSSGPSFT